MVKVSDLGRGVSLRLSLGREGRTIENGMEVKSEVLGDLVMVDLVKVCSGRSSSKFESIISTTSSSTSAMTCGVTGMEEQSLALEDEQVDDLRPWLEEDGVLDRWYEEDEPDDEVLWSRLGGVRIGRDGSGKCRD